MLQVTALPAKHGDCLWIEYGPVAQPSVILIDGGTGASKLLKKKLLDLAAKGGQLELVVVSHIDSDHIAGMIGLLDNDFFGVPVRDFWFNGLRHLPGEVFGEKQGEKLTKMILDKKLSWNGDFKGGPIAVDMTTGVVNLPGGASIHVLSPDENQLRRLRRGWIRICEEAGLYEDPLAEHIVQSEREAFGGSTLLDVDALADEPFEEDVAEANGSSIAFVLHYETHRILFGADAYPSRLLKSLKQLNGDAPYSFSLVKLPHHGSKNNVSIEFIEALRSPKYLFSSNGKIFGHPSPQAVARTVRHGLSPELIFNYETDITKAWNDPLLIAQHRYTVVYGTDGCATVEIA